MRNQSTQGSRRPTEQVRGQFCITCGLGIAHLRQCSCCDEWWLVCDWCEHAYGRVQAVG